MSLRQILIYVSHNSLIVTGTIHRTLQGYFDVYSYYLKPHEKYPEIAHNLINDQHKMGDIWGSPIYVKIPMCFNLTCYTCSYLQYHKLSESFIMQYFRNGAVRFTLDLFWSRGILTMYEGSQVGWRTYIFKKKTHTILMLTSLH